MKVNGQLHQNAEQENQQIAQNIPDNKCGLMVQVLAGAGLPTKVGFSTARRLVLQNTDKYALVIPMPEVSPSNRSHPLEGPGSQHWCGNGQRNIKESYWRA